MEALLRLNIALNYHDLFLLYLLKWKSSHKSIWDNVNAVPYEIAKVNVADWPPGWVNMVDHEKKINSSLSQAMQLDMSPDKISIYMSSVELYSVKDR